MADRRGTRFNPFYGQIAGAETQHKQFKFTRGTAPLTKVDPSEGGTQLSAGTIQVTTGLTTVYNFIMSLRSSATAGYTVKRAVPVILGWKRGYINAGGVTITLAGVTMTTGARAALTPGFEGLSPATLSGCTIHWLAFGVGN